MSARSAIEGLARGWRRRLGLAAAIAVVAAMLPASALAVADGWATTVWLLLWTGVSLGGAAAACTAWFRAVRLGRTQLEAAVAAHLDQTFPTLQNSADLLLSPAASLGPLSGLQRQRVEAAYAALGETVRLPLGPVRRAALLFAVTAAATAATVVIDSAPVREPVELAATATDGGAPAANRALELAITIRPPAYTARPDQVVDSLALSAIEGSLLELRVTPGDGLEQIGLQEGGTLRPLSRDGTSFVLTELLAQSRRVQLVMERRDGSVERTPSAWQIGVPDRPPEVRIVEPATDLELTAVTGRMTIAVDAVDDFGLGDATLVVTVANGSGEMVAFQERRVPLEPPPPDTALSWRTTAALDLGALDLAPAGELYVRAEVADRRQPTANTARSRTLILRAPGTREPPVELAGLVLPLAAPTTFRSQRQIIIDTEALLAAAPGLSSTELARRADAIGRDQGALRMRYGILLGDEFESGRPERLEHDDDHSDDDQHSDDQHSDDQHSDDQHSDEHDRTTSANPLAAFSHQHDSAESATFFADPIRVQLKAMLAAMWRAEGELRVAEPAAALPHEEVALELLKDLQQRSRRYVQKVAFTPQPWDEPALRLSGELDDIPAERSRPAAPADSQRATLERACALLSAGPLEPSAGPSLTAAHAILASRDAATVTAASLDALQRLADAAASGRPISDDDRAAAWHGLWQALASPPPRPTNQRAPSKLDASYRATLDGEHATAESAASEAP